MVSIAAGGIELKKRKMNKSIDSLFHPGRIARDGERQQQQFKKWSLVSATTAALSN
jgi:hypothetical protein